MAEEEEEEVKIDDFVSRVSREGFTVDDVTPFLPSVDYKFSDEGELDGYEVKFNQGYYFNRTSETQVQTRDDQKISNMGDPFDLPIEHDIEYYVEIIVNAENFLVTSATFTGVSGDDGSDITTQFPHILFNGDDDTEFTGYYPILKLKNGSLEEYTQRSNIQLSDRQFRQLGASVAGVSARPLVEDGHTSESNPVKVRNIVAGTGVTVEETATSIIINATGTGEAGGTGSCINIGSAVEVYNEGPPKSSNPFEFRTLTGEGNTDVLIDPNNGSQILISGGLAENRELASHKVYIEDTKKPFVFKGLEAGTGVYLESTDDNVIINVKTGQSGSCANTGDGIDVYVEGSSNPFIFRSLQYQLPSNKNNVSVERIGDNLEMILISGGISDNIGAGAQVYYQDSIRPFEFKTLTGAENITITDQGNMLEIKSEDQNCGSAGWQAYVDGTKNPAQFRGLNFGDGIIVDATDTCAPTISVDTGCCDLDDTLSVGSSSPRTLGVGGATFGSSYYELTPAADNLHVEGKMGVGVSPSEITSYSDKVVICGSMRVKGGAGSIPTEGDFYLGTALTPALKKRISFGRGILEIGTDIQELDFKYPQAISINPQGATSISHQSDLGGYDINYQSPATGSAILGGSGNAISGNYNVIIAGINNQISGGNTNVIGGGSGINVDSSEFSVSVGGRNNDVSGSNFAAIGGGKNNLISGSDSASIAGGITNQIKQAFAASIGGGQNNLIKNKASAIAGGESNTIEQKLIDGGYNFIGAGVSNTISGSESTIAGGNNNYISGSRSTTLGGAYQVIGADDAVTAGNYSKVQPSHHGAFVFSDSVTSPALSSGANTMLLSFKSGVFIDTDSGIYINGNPVMTGVSDLDIDTLQSVTTRGDTTTTNIISEKIVSGVTGAFGDVLAKGAFGIHGWQGDPDTHMKGLGDRIIFTVGGLTFADFSEGSQDLIHFNGNENQDIDFRVGYDGGASIFSRGSDGNVGIGTTNPSAALSVGDGGDKRASNTDFVISDDTPQIELRDTAKSAIISFNDSQGVRIFSNYSTSTSPQFTIENDGNVGIGTATPDDALTIVGTSADFSVRKADNGLAARIAQFNDGGAQLRLYDSGSNETIRLAGDGSNSFITGNVGIGTVSPSSALEVRGGNIDIGTNDIEGAANCKIEMDAADGFTLTNPNNAHGIDIVADDLTFFGGGIGNRKITTNAGDLSIDPTADLLLNETTGNVGIGTDSPSAKLDVRGDAFISGDVSGTGDGGRITHNGTGYLLVGEAAEADTLQSVTDRGNETTTAVQLNGGVVINESGSDLDFRVEGDTATHALFVNGADNHVGIGTSTPVSDLTVYSSDSNSATVSIHNIINNETGSLLRLVEGNNHMGGFLQFDGSANKFNIGVHSTNDTTFANDTKAITIDRDTANVGVGTTSPNVPFEIKGSVGSNLFGINTTTHGNFRIGPALANSRNAIKVSTDNSSLDLKFISSSERIYFGGNGDDQKVGVNTASPSSTLQVVGHTISISTTGIAGKGLHIGDSYNSLGIFGSSDVGSHYNPESLTFSAGNRNPSNSAYIDVYSRFGGVTGSFGDIDLNAGNNVGVGMSGDINLITSGQKRLVAKHDGSVGVGTDSPSAKFHVDNDTAVATGFLVENSSNKDILWAEDNETVNVKSTLNVYHTTVASRYLKLGWGSIYANDNGNELTLGSNYSSNSATRIFVTAEGADNTPSDTIQMQANRGLAVFSGVSTDTFEPTALLDVRGDAFISGSVEGTGAGNRITNNGVPYLLSGDSPAETQTLQDVCDNDNTTTTNIISEKIVSGVTGLFSNQVGIGTTPNTDADLHVYATGGAPEFRISRGSNNQVWTQSIDSSSRFLLKEAASEGGTQNTRLSIDDAGETLLCMNGGSCGIGTVSVNQNASKTTLDIHHATVGAAIRLRQASNSALIRYDDTNGLQVGTIASKNLSFETADTTAITIDTSQNVGIGTTSPAAKLELVGKQMITAGANASPQTEDYLYIGGDGLAGADAAIYIGNRGNGSGYGWRMFYEGTGSGNDNKLKFKSENLGSPVDVITMLQDGKVGIGATEPSVGLQLGNSTSGQTKTAIFNSEGGAEVGLTIKSRTNRAKLAVSDNDTTAYVVAEGTIASFGKADTAASTNISVLTDGSVGIGSTSPSRLLTLENNSSTVSNNSQLRINNIGAGDAYIYLFAGSDWSLGIDNSDSDKFKLCTTNDVSDGTEVVTVDRSGNVGIGTTSPSNALDVVGHFSATSKSFLINHPTKENKKLQYASLEGPENGVYVRGTTDKETIELPEYWSELVHEDSITVVLTPIGKKQDLFIKEKSNKLIKIGGAEGSFDYVVYGERKDIDKLEIEPLKV